MAITESQVLAFVQDRINGYLLNNQEPPIELIQYRDLISSTPGQSGPSPGLTQAQTTLAVRDGINQSIDLDAILAGVGVVTEAPPTTDTGDSGLVGMAKRLAQRVTSLIQLFPSSLSNDRLVVDGSQVVQPISADALPLPTGAATNAQSVANATSIVDAIAAAEASANSDRDAIIANLTAIITGLADILAEQRDDVFIEQTLWEYRPTPSSSPVFYREERIRNQDNGSISTLYTRLSDNTTVVSLPSGSNPVDGNAERQVQYLRWKAKTAATGVLIGDWLLNTIIYDTTTSGIPLSSTWYNLSQGQVIAAPPSELEDPTDSLLSSVGNDTDISTAANFAAVATVKALLRLQGTRLDSLLTSLGLRAQESTLQELRDRLPTTLGQALNANSLPTVLPATQIAALTPPSNTGYALDSSLELIFNKLIANPATEGTLQSLLNAWNPSDLGTPSATAVTTTTLATSSTIVAVNANRKFIEIQNDTEGVLYFKFRDVPGAVTSVAGGYHRKVFPGDIYRAAGASAQISIQAIGVGVINSLNIVEWI